MIKVGVYLAEKRAKSKKTQKDVSLHLGLSNNAQYISNVERGLCNPTLAHLGKWCEFIGANKNTVFRSLCSEYRAKVRDGLGLNG